MADSTAGPVIRPIHPLHAVLLAGMLPLFLGGLLSDWAYDTSAEIQWNNFAMWLLAGAMVFAGFSLLWALIELFTVRVRTVPVLAGFLVLLAVFVVGLIDCFVHSRDAFGTMPTGLVLSVIVTLLSIVAVWIGFSRWRGGVVR